VELIGGVFLVQFLSQMTGTLIQFKYVDFRLLFVVIMGSIYGIKTGLYAAVLVSISILYTWVQLGFDWALLVYNVGNWLPFALYFTAGLITGYYHDKSENQILNAEKQTRLISDKYTFLYGVFNDIRKLKDEFRERLLGYRDSFGKIYTITKELDQLQEHSIYLRALSILEEHMDNRNIAIYSVDGDGRHARLEASSMSMNGSPSKSINLSNFPEMLPSIKAGTIFQNSTLLPGYPSYLVPIFNNDCPAAMIAIWSVNFEQYSTYYYNRLKVICGLIEASLVRAALFSNANYERMHLPTTRILNHQAFKDALKIRVEMKKNRISDFQLVMLKSPNRSMQEIYPSIYEEIRNRDVIGMGNDGVYYILLSQADKVAAQDIVERLNKFGVQSSIVDTSQVLTD
jgi:UDP-glucose 4-epimerase